MLVHFTKPSRHGEVSRAGAAGVPFRGTHPKVDSVPPAAAAVLLAMAFAIGGSWSARAAQINASSAARSDVLTAYNQALPGDVVVIPAGTSSWSGSLTITKPLTIRGAGPTATGTKLVNTTTAGQGLESPVFEVDLAVDGPVRIEGIWFADDGLDRNSSGVQISYGAVHERQVQISNCQFEGFSFGVVVSGAFGVCYNSTFLNNKVAARISGYSSSSQLNGLVPPFPWNSTNYFVFEDCTISLTNWGIDCYMMDTEYPVNYMVRHCQFNINRSTTATVDGFDMHGNSGGSEDRLGIVIYKNTFNYTGNNTVNPIKFVDIRGGVGSLVYSNTVTGVNIYATMRDDPYAPPLMTNTYLWENFGGGGNPMQISGSSGVTLGVNYFTGPPPNFSQLPYPHPLRAGGSGSPPRPPSNVTAQFSGN